MKAHVPVSIGAVVLLGIVATGALHTRAGKALWRRVAPAPSCPFGYDVTATAEQRAASRRAFSSSHRGTRASPWLAADRWDLAATPRAEVVAWAAERSARCASHGGDLECTGVPGFDSVWFGFDGDRLVALTQFRSASVPAPIHEAFAELVRVGHARYAAPTQFHEPDLARGPLQQEHVEWRFSNLYVSASATNMGRDRYVLIDEYRLLTD